MISMIAAIGANNELGYGNDLIWKIPNDMKRFREKTRGHPVIMGRKTYESIGRLLPDRANIIITRDKNFSVEGALVSDSIEEAIEKAKNEAGSDEIFIIGGSQIYSLAIPHADKLYITKINSSSPVADTFFPDYSEFKKIEFSEKHNDDGLEYEFIDLTRQEYGQPGVSRRVEERQE